MNFKKIRLTSSFLLALILAGCHKPGNQHSVEQETDHVHGPITIYSHGYMCNKEFARFFHNCLEKPNKINPNAFILGKMIAFNYGDYKNPFLCRLGQGDDIERLHNACKDHENVIIVGTSRGASTIINYLGTYKPTNILAAVLESPFDHANNVANNLLSKFSIKDKEGLINTVRPFLFRNYDPDGIQPIKVAADVSKDIPILLICSKSDGLIPDSSTANLYKVLKDSGHPHVYLLTCKYGSHGRILWSKDGALFKNVVHAFYKHHNLPHHEPWAQEGFEQFQQCLGWSEN